jgi:hypothetical protein
MIEQSGFIGRYASEELRQPDERPLFAHLVGVRYNSIEVRLTRKDYSDPAVQEWLQMFLFQRVNRAGKTPVNITVFC